MRTAIDARPDVGARTLSTDSPDVFDAIRERLTPRQAEIYYYKYVGEKLNSTVAAILRVSLSTIEKELHVIRRIRDEVCTGGIEQNVVTDIPIARGHTLAIGSNRVLRAVITGENRRRIPRP